MLGIKVKEFKLKLSIIVCVYNEVSTIQQIYDEILVDLINNIEKEIIIIDNNSTDGTKEILKKLIILIQKSSSKIKILVKEIQL